MYCERLAGVTLLPALTTGVYYCLPIGLQQLTAVQLLPQFVAYVAFGLWVTRNRHITDRLGLQPGLLRQGVTWGFWVGASLGLLNTSVILWVVPILGGDIAFLAHTPHARVPVPLMIPWVIVLIAAFVEINFRGFQLGRWVTLLRQAPLPRGRSVEGVVAVGISAILFAFDPFMVATFKSLHWIAVWDGLVWGCLWLRLRNLYAIIAAHTLEVIIIYTILRTTLM